MQLHNFLKSRHSVRRFSTRPVDAEMIDRLLDEAAQAPNTGNLQMYCAVVTDTPEGIKELAPAHYNQPAAANAPVIVTFCADCNRVAKWYGQRDADVESFDNIEGFLGAMADAVIFAQQFVVAAEGRGLGTCYLGTTLYEPAEVARVLDLPERVIPVVAVSVGWPADEETEAGPTDRLPLSAVVHHGKYKDFSPQDIDNLYAALEADPQSEKFTNENKVKTLAQVFAQVRYPREAADRNSERLAEFLRKNHIHFPKSK